MIQNPYRKGIAAGEAAAEAFIAWRDEANRTRDYSKARPIRPTCPYTTAFGTRQWEDGFRVGMRRKGVS
jgi:ribosome modulation factor